MGRQILIVRGDESYESKFTGLRSLLVILLLLLLLLLLLKPCVLAKRLLCSLSSQAKDVRKIHKW